MPEHGKLNYVEFPAEDLQATKRFFNRTFGWEFVDYGPDYTSFANEGLDGGFFRASLCSEALSGSALLVFYSNALQQTLEQVVLNGGEILKPIFSFPGGRRFHFKEPSGNEFAVWSDKDS